MDPYMGDTTAASLWRETLTVKLNKLQPVGEVASNPVQSHASYTRVLSLSSRIFYSMVSKALERARKQQEHVHCDQEQGRFFHIGQSMLTKLNYFS